ncbi:class IV adenylate cyclase [Providencia vermicola]|uniref:class IV adenylate cyclase n=1 Tax=Providencia TaxID=586 RepID=UPI0012B61EB0|nr:MULTISPECIES: class IV adenylate cyclase [Providencia]ELR5141415.1 class IV adenylate cyclase [Providencia stuartii]MBG5918611.1 class IV adenylate cyclase [Providencia stuartii]MTB39179.1 CYTH domain-containing protein [Providencia sp. wls1949]MTC08728.1 CYTH domain-containing protein [Providencia sp. wls1948]WER23909.1 class IV adenylate cyclase [Providencia stuartii]
MSKHFVGQYEAEIKFKLPHHQQFLHAIKANGADLFTADNTETDYFFDTPDQQLAQQGISMSVREMHPSGIKLWIVKGPEASECKAIDIEDCTHVKKMLTTLGYQCYFTASKIRSIYFLGDAHITIDYLVDIGWFAEFAIMTNESHLLPQLTQQMLRLAQQYGLNETMIERRSYKEIQLAQSNITR